MTIILENKFLSMEKITTEKQILEKAPVNQEKTFLSRTECNIMRGFAILFIVVNNFTHLLNGVFKDNEYVYLWSNVEGVMNNLAHPDSVLPFNILSFYCPYGVMLFIFLSGYGLTLKYEKTGRQQVSSWSFVSDHYSKLFTMQLKGLAIYFTILLLFYKDHLYSGVNTLLQLLLIGNLNPRGTVVPGPYWFFGMIMEMYVIYRLLIYRRSDKVMWAVVAFSLIVMAFNWNHHYLRINCFLAILPFCLGVFAARHLDARFARLDKSSACWWCFLLSFVLLTLCKFNFYTWLFMPIFVVATAVTVVKLMCRVSLLAQVFGWLGAISGVMFVVHPGIRTLLVDRANESGHYFSVVLIYMLVTIGLSMMLQPVFGKSKKEKKD